MAPDAIREAFLSACHAELQALKPGNVHIHAAGHDMVAAQFEAAAAAAAPIVADASLAVGIRIRRAVEASLNAAGCNTNLGILLLCVPLAKAAELAAGRTGDGGSLRHQLVAVLDGLDVADAAEAYRAIALANPGGLGSVASEDVSAAATVTLKQAMAQAAGRDRIARAYVTGYEDIFEFALPFLRTALLRSASPELAVTALHLALLATYPDSHVARKYGAEVAEDVRRRAAALRGSLGAFPTSHALPQLLEFDASLKARRINPGTTADFVVTTLFVTQLDLRRPVAETLV
jgi:triphosphoribosyl-dephospho-CoA synthase